MKNSILLLTLSLVVSLFLGCDKSNPVGNGGTNELIPLKLGNSWINVVSDYDSNRVITRIRVDSVWVSKDSTLNGEKYFVISKKSGDSGGTLYLQSSICLARNTPFGYEQIYSEYSKTTYRYPIIDSDSMVISTNEIVTVPAGTFNCIVYKFIAGLINTDTEPQILYGKIYICPNVGIIKEELTIPRNNYGGYSSVLSRTTRN
jgi:hypothetical protein